MYRHQYTIIIILIVCFRQANARAKAEQADMSSEQSRRDSEVARVKGKEFAPEFHQPGRFTTNKSLQINHYKPITTNQSLRTITTYQSLQTNNYKPLGLL